MYMCISRLLLTPYLCFLGVVIDSADNVHVCFQVAADTVPLFFRWHSSHSLADNVHIRACLQVCCWPCTCFFTCISQNSADNVHIYVLMFTGVLLTCTSCFSGGVFHITQLTLFIYYICSCLHVCCWPRTCFSGGVFHGYLSIPRVDYPAGARSHAAGIGAGDRVLHQPQVGTPPWRKGQWTPDRLSTVGSRAFSVSGPSARNDLPLRLRQKPSLDSFRCNLKTLLFPKLWTFHVFCSVLLSTSISSVRLLPILSCVNLALYSQNAWVCGCLCVCACMRVCLCACVCTIIVSMDKILHFTNCQHCWQLRLLKELVIFACHCNMDTNQIWGLFILLAKYCIIIPCQNR